MCGESIHVYSTRCIEARHLECNSELVACMQDVIVLYSIVLYCIVFYILLY